MGLGHSPRIVTDGLVLALDAQNSKSWKSGTTWTDTFGGNNGTLTNGTSHSDGPFPEAGYVEFDGSTEYLSLADSTDFDLGLSSEAFTMEAWVNASSLGTNVIIGRGGGSGSWNATNGHQYLLFYSGGTDLYFQWWNGSGFSSINSTGALTTNVWAHLAVVFDGTDVKMYKNGTLLATGSSATFAKPSASNITRIGSAASGSVWDGYISNVRIVKGTALYTSDFTPPSSPLTAVTNTKLLCCQGGTNVDASPSAHSFQVIIGVPTLTSVGPSATKYFEFDGSNDYIDVGSTNIPAGPLTVSAWINLSSDVSIATIAASNGDWIFGTTSRKPFAYNYASAAQTTAPNGESLSIGVWYNVVMVQGSSLDVYINGSLSATNADGTDMTATEDLDIGRRSGNNDRYHHGKIADLKIYSKALTASEVEQNYNATKGRYV